jgi:hypothetical protein
VPTDSSNDSTLDQDVEPDPPVEPECLPQIYDLPVITPSQGLLFDGIEGRTHRLGIDVSRAGDVNGDGYDDIIVSGADRDIVEMDARVLLFLVFGSPSRIGSFDVSSIDRESGVVITGRGSISAAGIGDVNRDGYGDLLVGDPNPGPMAGEVYLLFGALDFGAAGPIDLPTTDEYEVMRIQGTLENDLAGQWTAGAGDVNGDGDPDLAIGAPFGGPDVSTLTGEAFIVFSSPPLLSIDMLPLASLDGSNGVKLFGGKHMDGIGIVSGAGDVNGDGFDDLLTGSMLIDIADPDPADEAYLVFGGSHVDEDGSLPLASLDGNSGIRFGWHEVREHLGFFVAAAGDVDSDRYDDIIIEVRSQDSIGAEDVNIYLIYGSPSPDTDGYFDLLSMAAIEGFEVSGIISHDVAKANSTGAGDVNADGYEDFLVSVNTDTPTGPAESILVFGRSDLATEGTLMLAEVSPAGGVRFTDTQPDMWVLLRFSPAGDFNGDGYADLLFGAPNTMYSPRHDDPPGRAFLVLGGPVCP